jgi:1-acyl-sn-glycerol-3-phosphate acyltransferase
MRPWQLRPARDFGQPLGRRLRSAGREPGLLSQTAHLAWSTLVRAYLAVCHRLVVAGRENLPGEAPFVMIANHCSHLDALSLSAALPRRLSQRAYALAAGEVFFAALPVAGFAALALNALPVWRKHTSSDDLALLRQRLVEDGAVFILFPEGTRSRTGEMARFRPGIGALVAGSDIPVVPCFLAGAHAAWPPGRALPRWGRLQLRIGAPLAFPAAANERAGWTDIAAACEAAVRAMGGDQRTTAR